jgi:hypothetical protein
MKTKKLSFKKWLKNVEASNDAFAKMSKSGKRVQIAKDVIARINYKRIVANTGSLIEDDTVLDLKERKGTLKETINSTKECQVCVKGGLFISYVGRANEFDKALLDDNEINVGSHDHESNEMVKLQEIFSSLQLAKIEAAFEGRVIVKGNTVSDSDQNKLRGFANAYYDDNERMIAICENIISNKGKFKI